MLDLYAYLLEKLTGHHYVKAVYACTGLASMEGLTEDVRKTKFPCVMVDVGTDGNVDFSNDGQSFKTVHSFYVLASLERTTEAEAIREVLEQTKEQGVRIAAEMRLESFDQDQPCYGLDRSNVGFYSVGPIANCYGYCFNLTFTRDHE